MLQDQRILLLSKDLDLVLVHKSGTGKACGFQLTQLLAQLFAHGQHGDVVAAAQGVCLGEDGGEVCILAIEQGLSG